MTKETNDFVSLTDEIEILKHKRKPMFYIFRHNYKDLFKKAKRQVYFFMDLNDKQQRDMNQVQHEMSQLRIENLYLKSKMATLCDSKIKDLNNV